ncbi:uncharacterized protein CEXT_387141 [Caerostris extrusa]|uniref:Uncharacterized protein n=1 Tax=Caerostris extrusa TaxID=172846 RepID=A0AAV4P5K0_CAEEX|nr:uncharacterized protein CEXT_387141 [Caerostris extrusa]
MRGLGDERDNPCIGRKCSTEELGSGDGRVGQWDEGCSLELLRRRFRSGRSHPSRRCCSRLRKWNRGMASSGAELLFFIVCAYGIMRTLQCVTIASCWALSLYLLFPATRAQILTDRPLPIDQLVQMVWDPSALIYMWTALDQFYNIALGWHRAARSMVSLPFRDGRSMDHVRINSPKILSQTQTAGCTPLGKIQPDLFRTATSGRFLGAASSGAPELAAIASSSPELLATTTSISVPSSTNTFSYLASKSSTG